MAKTSKTRAIVLSSTKAAPAASAAPVSAVKRVIAKLSKPAAKPATGLAPVTNEKHNPVAKPAAKPPVAVPAAPVATATDKPADTAPRGLARDASGIVAGRTNYDQYSDRDSAYLRFFGTVCRANGHRATLRQIHDSGVKRTDAPDRKRYNPHYAGSGKATDVGAINRLIAAGYFAQIDNGNCIVATDKAKSARLYLGNVA